MRNQTQGEKPHSRGQAGSIPAIASLFYLKTKKEICKIENKSQHIDIVIKEEPIVLQEVSVKSEKVWENNDTISYLADAFRDTTDIVIADVLKKMPGIEVKDDGKIEYKGKAISKFYIEDMDMLQGRYNIATNNIPASNVHLVQVMENHQEVKALKNIDFNQIFIFGLTRLNSMAEQ